MSTKTVHVLQEDIDKGQGDEFMSPDGSSCPVWQALTREDIFAGHQIHVTMGAIESREIRTGDSDFFWRIMAPLPKDAQNKIRTFDNTGKMEPFDFEIEVRD